MLNASNASNANNARKVNSHLIPKRDPSHYCHGVIKRHESWYKSF